mgnify:CR=1 FL=1
MIGRFLRPRAPRIVALLAVRNEQDCLARCLRHLVDQGLQVAVIDNESTDRTPEIIRSLDPDNLVRHEVHPFPGHYDWEAILRRKQELAAELDADWFVHVDADEIPESPFPGLTLAEALQHVEREGANAVNFNEFVFVPTSDEEAWEGRDYVAGMAWYYFFEPRPLRLVRAWKKGADPVDIAGSGGHDAQFPGRVIAPTPFVLRHYLTLSRRHLIEKYGSRVFSSHELEKGWHHNRVGIETTTVPWPSSAELHHVDGTWNTSQPRTRHFFESTP